MCLSVQKLCLNFNCSGAELPIMYIVDITLLRDLPSDMP